MSQLRRSTLLIAVVLCSSNCAQRLAIHRPATLSVVSGTELLTQDRASAEEVPSEDHPAFRPRTVDFTPYNLARRINGNEHRYKKGVSLDDRDLTHVWSGIGVAAGDFEQADGSLHVTVTRARLDRDRMPEVLVKITRGLDFCRYVIFKHHTSVARGVKGTWVVVAVLDHKFNKYQMVSHSIVSSAGEHFLILRGQTGSGSGFSRYEDAWFRLDSRGVRRVLSYDAAGHDAPWPCGLGRQLSSTVVPVASYRSTGAFDVTLSLTFSSLDYMNERYRTFAAVARRVRFEWNAKRYRLRFDARASQTTERRIATVFGLEGYEPAEGRALLAEHWRNRAKRKLATLAQFEAGCTRLMDDMAKRRKTAN